MSDDAMDFLDLMGREGPCFHCGIDYTPLWRCGPPEKPVLCNACGSRWKTKGSLEGYIPKHAIKEGQSSQSSRLSSKFLPTSSIPNGELEEAQVVSNAVGQDQFSPFLGEGTNYGSSSASETIFSKNHSHLQVIDEANQPPLWDPNDVSKKKRSILEQRVLSPTERLHQQLYNTLQDYEFTKKSDADKDDDDEDVLIFERINHYIPENEIGLGCMLLKQPLSPPKGSKTESTSMLKSSSSSKESKLESSHGLKISTSPIGDNHKLESCLIEVPKKDSSQDEIIALNNENSLDVNETMRGPRNDYHHHMITRSRTSNKGAYRPFKDFYSFGTPGEGKVASQPNRRPRGRPPKGQNTSRNSKKPTQSFQVHHSFSEAAPSSNASNSSSMLSAEETQIHQLIDDVQNQLSRGNSGTRDVFTFAANSEHGIHGPEGRTSSDQASNSHP